MPNNDLKRETKTFTVTLTTKEPLRIGALQDVLSGVDNPVARIGGKVVVQGSSLKGALRAKLEEYLIETYPDDYNMRPCIPSPANTLSKDEQTLIKMGRYRQGGACRYSIRDKSNSICPICYLLGSNGLMGFVRVPYLFTNATPEELYSVRIDRATGVVSERTNRDYQIMATDIDFVGQLEILTKDPRRGWELGKPRKIGEGEKGFDGDKWLTSGDWDAEKITDNLILERLKSIDLLGGFKSKGCGKVHVTIN